MALTQETTPQLYTPVYNEAVFVYSSTNSGQTNFRYKCELQDGITSTTLATFNIFPDTSGYGIVNCARILESYVTQDINVSDDGFKTNDNSFKSFKLVVTERYGSPLADDDTDTSSVYFGWNASFTYNNFLSFTYSDHVFTASSGTTSFLTKQPRTVKIDDNENAWLYMATEANSAPEYMRIITYDSVGSQVGTFQVDNLFNSIGVLAQRRFLRFPTGTRNLNLITSNFTTGSAPIITSDVASYVIYAENASSQQISEQFTYEIENNCSVNDKVRLTFLNSRGGFDSFTFNGAVRSNVNITKENYLKKTSSFSGGSYGYDLQTHRRNQFYTDGVLSGVLNSRQLTNDESQWLLELAGSPLVYVDNGSSLIACNVETTSYDILRTENREPTNVSFDIWYSKSKRQRG